MRIWPLLLVLAVVAVLGLRAGVRHAGQTESTVILRVAAQHVARGGRASDCSARPAAQPWLWLEVTCGPPAAPWRYAIGPLGGIWAVHPPQGVQDAI